MRSAPVLRRRERGVRFVVLLTAATMVIELVVGYRAHSMALLADGWHMATHVGALGLASAAYWVSRRFAGHRALAFGTGKVPALAGYSSALALGFVAVATVLESIERLLHPQAIDFVRSLPVAVLGLVVNLLSAFLLHAYADEDEDNHDHDHGRGHRHHHDHNHRAALLHVVADALTSVLAIVALLAGKLSGATWLDPITGIVGGVLILKWGAELCRNAAFELLDVSPWVAVEDEIREVLEALDDVRVSDLHVWSLGGGAKSCVVTVVTAAPRETRRYREALAPFGLAHLTIEVQRCEKGHEHSVVA